MRCLHRALFRACDGVINRQADRNMQGLRNVVLRETWTVCCLAWMNRRLVRTGLRLQRVINFYLLRTGLHLQRVINFYLLRTGLRLQRVINFYLLRTGLCLQHTPVDKNHVTSGLSKELTFVIFYVPTATMLRCYAWAAQSLIPDVSTNRPASIFTGQGALVSDLPTLKDERGAFFRNVGIQ